MPIFNVDAGNATESLLQFILDNMTQDQSDQVEIKRSSAPTAGLGGEPLTVGAAITLASVIAPYFVQLIGKWMDGHQELARLEVVASGFEKSDKAGEELAKLAAINSRVNQSIEPKPKQKQPDR